MTREDLLMRVIAGSARRLLLKTLDGNDTRPTTDRIKETLFNILQDRIYGCTFLDLFAGSGGIGIEALSRGAGEAVFVESNRKAVDIIKDNLVRTHLDDKANVLLADAAGSIGRLESHGPFPIIFMDPPYGKELERGVLERLAHSSLADEDTLIIIEAALETDFGWVNDLGFEIVREKTYKTNKHVFLVRREEEATL